VLSLISFHTWAKVCAAAVTIGSSQRFTETPSCDIAVEFFTGALKRSALPRRIHPEKRDDVSTWKIRFLPVLWRKIATSRGSYTDFSVFTNIETIKPDVYQATTQQKFPGKGCTEHPKE
jgi:hypothetical protein